MKIEKFNFRSNRNGPVQVIKVQPFLLSPFEPDSTFEQKWKTLLIVSTLEQIDFVSSSDKLIIFRIVINAQGLTVLFA